MIKKQTAIILFVALLSGCGVAANDPQTNNDNVPINNQINTPQAQTQSSQSGDETQNNDDPTDQTKAQQVTQTDAERANEELAQADETGILVSMDGDHFELEITNFSTRTEGDEEIDIAISSEEKLKFTITSETEIKVILYDAQSHNSRIVEGSRADLQLERSVSLYGQRVGDTFIATKVLVLQIN
ncbi:hypothetical protein ABQE21_02600 [Enterococcus casseliflavus]|uniref:hypothetical protein n=1 Tax=Enterococcus casseliflavus TaxID=37734 RepID=UPI000AA87B17|nr:hypothetical protein [Enterococcus casseliflavus]WBY93397.1 hypothetical protein PEZ80_06710 [Enterococcus casseliflavus]STQ30709.1 Uncharacterised protein [Enterococcus casseliflavus]